MAGGKKPDGVTMLVRVPEGMIEAAAAFYGTILQRPHDFQPSPDLREWELKPDVWLLVGEGTPPQNGRIRFGSTQIDAERDLIHDALGVEITAVETLDGIVAWCNFDDPWGNSLGIFQDLAKWPRTRSGEE